MKTKSKIAIVVFAASLFFPGLASAAVNTTLYIQGPGGTVLVNSALVVPESCTVVDNTGAAHDFSGHQAPCAIQAAKDTGLIADFVFRDFGGSLGLFLKSINGIADGPAPDYPYWNLWRNGVFSDVGISQILLSQGDTFQLTYGPYITPIIPAVQTPGGPVVVDVFPRRVDIENAISFLTANQEKDGSFGHPLFTDWAGVALGAYGGKSTSAFYGVTALKEWFSKNPVPAGSPLTDYERRAMALMSLGVNPYQGTSQNVIGTIESRFDGTQFGNPGLVNDDIFAALVLRKAGYEANVTPLLETLPFILSWQKESGSFGSLDITAAAVQALTLFPRGEQRDAALSKARAYLASQQDSSGGFGNAYSTPWVLQAIAALNEDGDAWAMGADKRTPEHFLALRQGLDGGLLKDDSPENRIWATSYAIPAALQKSWGTVLGAFERPAQPQPATQTPPELKPEEVTALQARITALQGRIISLTTTLYELERIEREVFRIAKEVDTLKPQVAAFYSAHLAQQQKEPAQKIAAAPELPSSSEFSSFTPGAGSQVSLEDKGGEWSRQFAAQAAGKTGQNFFSSGVGQLVLALGAAVILFLFFGGWKTAAPFLQRRYLI